MPLVRYRIRPGAPFRSLPSASMLWGHLSWAIRELEGESALQDWIEVHRAAIENGTSPPLRLSSAFPQGLLPRPILKPLGVEETELRKRLKAVRWVRPELFAAMLSRGEEALREALSADGKMSVDDPFLRLPRTRVAMNRSTGTAAEGQLFQDAVYWVRASLDVYAEVESSAWADRVFHLLVYVGSTGFGGGASVGLGAFEVSPPEPAELPRLQGEAEVLLGPALLPPGARGYWKATLYWGRLGNVYAHAPVPFKRPYLRVQEGSVLRSPEPKLLDVTPAQAPHSETRVYEYLAPLTLPVPEGVVE